MRKMKDVIPTPPQEQPKKGVAVRLELTVIEANLIKDTLNKIPLQGSVANLKKGIEAIDGVIEKINRAITEAE